MYHILNYYKRKSVWLMRRISSNAGIQKIIHLLRVNRTRFEFYLPLRASKAAKLSYFNSLYDKHFASSRN